MNKKKKEYEREFKCLCGIFENSHIINSRNKNELNIQRIFNFFF